MRYGTLACRQLLERCASITDGDATVLRRFPQLYSWGNNEYECVYEFVSEYNCVCLVLKEGGMWRGKEKRKKRSCVGGGSYASS